MATAVQASTDAIALEAILREMAEIQEEMVEDKKRWKKLQDRAFPLVEAAGDHYEVDDITADIDRPTTLEINAVRLLERFGEKAHGLLTVSVKKYRAAVASDLLGSAKERRGIAKSVDQTARFVLKRK